MNEIELMQEKLNKYDSNCSALCIAIEELLEVVRNIEGVPENEISVIVMNLKNNFEL